MATSGAAAQKKSRVPAVGVGPGPGWVELAVRGGGVGGPFAPPSVRRRCSRPSTVGALARPAADPASDIVGVKT